MNPLDDISLTAAPKHAPKPVPTSVQDFLDTVPVATSNHSEWLVDYPARYGDGESLQVQTRVPIQWVEQIDELRERPGVDLPLGTLWPTRSHFYRWCIFVGMSKLRDIIQDVESRATNSDQTSQDPMLEAMLFVEQVQGRIGARASILNDAIAGVQKIGQALAKLIAINEYVEAGNMVNQWIAGARNLGKREETKYWETIMVKVLVYDQVVGPIVKRLVTAGIIDDEFVVGAIESVNFVEVEQIESELGIATIPVSVDRNQAAPAARSKRSKD